MGRVVGNSFLQEMGLELCLGEGGGQTEGVPSVNVCNGERSGCVQGLVKVEQTQILASLSSIFIFEGWYKAAHSLELRLLPCKFNYKT